MHLNHRDGYFLILWGLMNVENSDESWHIERPPLLSEGMMPLSANGGSVLAGRRYRRIALSAEAP